MVKALLFDLDGTLADTDPLHLLAWREALRP
jgi:beta-phosphoglucomutase-like phosphatase (HAD superfamily)